MWSAEIYRRKKQTLSLSNNYLIQSVAHLKIKSEIPSMPIKQYKYTLSGKSSIGFIKADIVIKTHYFPLIYSHISCWFLLFCFSLTPLYKDERTIYASLHSGISFTRTRNSERKALNKCALNKNNMSTTALVKISNERQNKTEI